MTKTALFIQTFYFAYTETLYKRPKYWVQKSAALGQQLL